MRTFQVWRGEQSGEEFEVFDRRKVRDGGFFFAFEKVHADGYDYHGDAKGYTVTAKRVLDLTQDTIENRRWVARWAESFDEWIDRYSGEEVDPFDVVTSGRLFDYEGDWSTERWEDLMLSAEADGYDAVIAFDTLDGMTEPVLVVFDNSQIHRNPETRQTFSRDCIPARVAV